MDKTGTSVKGFTTQRLLVGDFEEASNTLKSVMRELMVKRFFSPSPAIVVHPKEMIEGGLSPVEERVFRELAISCGASNAAVHIGADLSDIEVKQLLSKK